MMGSIVIGTNILAALATIHQIDQKTKENGLPIAAETKNDLIPLAKDLFSLAWQSVWLRGTQSLNSEGELSEAGEQQAAQIREQKEANTQKLSSRVHILTNDLKEKGLSGLIGGTLSLLPAFLFKLGLIPIFTVPVFALSLVGTAAAALGIKLTGETLPASFAIALKEVNVSGIKDPNNHILTSTLREAGINLGPDYIATAHTTDLADDVRGIGMYRAATGANGIFEAVKEIAPFTTGLANWGQDRVKDIANLSFELSGSNFRA